MQLALHHLSTGTSLVYPSEPPPIRHFKVTTYFASAVCMFQVDVWSLGMILVYLILVRIQSFTIIIINDDVL